MKTSNSIQGNHQLRQERIARNWRQHDLAEQLETTAVTVKRWERGSHQPSLYFRAKLCTLFGKSAQELGLVSSAVSEEAPVWRVPFPRNPFFTGRDHILDQLHTLLTNEPTSAALTPSVALSGLGGIGKTQLALEYAYQHRSAYTAVLWVESETQASLTTSFVRIAGFLTLSEQTEEDQSKIVAAVLRWLHQQKRWLLVFDNVEDLALIKPFLPANDWGAVLLTTRLQALGTLAQRVDLSPLTHLEGYNFLLARTNRLRQHGGHATTHSQEKAAAQAIVTEMGGLPLALEQAAAYIDATGCSFSLYLHRLQNMQHDLLNRHELSSDHPLSVSQTFIIAFEQVGQRNQLAIELLRVCAMLQAEAIPEELFIVGAAHMGAQFEALSTNLVHFDQALAVLRRLSLVQRQVETRTLSLHRLVQAVVRQQMSKQEQIVWLRRVIAAINTAIPEEPYEAWSQCERLLPHLLACATMLSDQQGGCNLGKVLRKAADYLRERIQYEQAESLYKRALRIWEQENPPDHREGMHALNGLAGLCYERAQFEQAEALYQRAWSIGERVLGAVHCEGATSLNGLATVSLRKGKYERAEKLYQQALHMRKQIWGSEHPDVAASLNNLAYLNATLGKHEQAEQFYQQAVRIYQQALGVDHPLVAYPLHGMAHLYAMQEKYEQAEPLYQQAGHIYERALGAEHPLVAYSLNDLAKIYTEQNRYEEGETLYLQAAQIWEQAWGPEHLLIADVFDHLAGLYIKQGKDEKAEPLYQQALCIREQHLGRQHPETAETVYHLAVFRQKQGKLSEARSFAEQALKIRSQSLGDAHSQTVAARMLYMQLCCKE